MRNRIEELLKRYWEGETSLGEERELRDLLAKSDGYDAEKSFFLGISDFSAMMEISLENPSKKSKGLVSFWGRIAAGIVVFLIAGISIYTQHRNRAEKEAYEQVLQAFVLIQENMQKGTGNLEVLQDLQYLNTPNELFDIETK
ncbi:hypothetical protein [Cecembia rubra]|uniref:Uncharacterized protein n=1 Tax=Cecembia rubra TaxID=1485585 RepID=A0A2P8E4J5_9BACT|nr:hypothetical protein [Cecembia rubra]PSL04398.1 hypothetical protein CLV48_105142 [Cecembia rubra]